jgi:gas vesicle protein
VTDQSRIALSVLAGAVIGGVAGFLMFTERGRQARAEIQPQLEELAREMQNLQELAMRVRATATDSWKQMEAFVSELGQQGHGLAEEARRH